MVKNNNQIFDPIMAFSFQYLLILMEGKFCSSSTLVFINTETQSSRKKRNVTTL